jgi:hypothetical protein
LEIVGLDYYKEPELDYPDEYEEDYVGAQVFDNMASSLMKSPLDEVATFSLEEKCSVCGLPVAIMQRNTCFDPKCGIK